MGIISKKDVKHVAKLAKLKLADGDIDKFSEQLSKIISYVKELEKVDTSKTEPTNQTTGLENVSGEDIVDIETSLTQDEALSGTESTHNGYFLVDAIFQSKDE